MIEFLELALFMASAFSWMDPGSDPLCLALLGVSGVKLFASSAIFGLSWWWNPPKVVGLVAENGEGADDENDGLLGKDP